MRFSKFILLASTSIAAPITAPIAPITSPIGIRDAGTITAAISNIVNQIADLNATVNTFKVNFFTTIPTVLKIEQQTTDLGDAVSAATDEANASGPLSNDDSGTVATAVVNLVPQIKSLLANLVAHKPVFDKVVLGVGSVSPQVKSDLEKQLELSKAFSAALIAKLSPSYAAFAPLITDQINGAFEDAIKAFSVPGGLFRLPPVKGLGEFTQLLNNIIHGRWA